jgi:hypothetical protein
MLGYTISMPLPRDSPTETGPIAAWSGIVVGVARTKGIRYENMFRVHMVGTWDEFGMTRFRNLNAVTRMAHTITPDIPR